MAAVQQQTHVDIGELDRRHSTAGSSSSTSTSADGAEIEAVQEKGRDFSVSESSGLVDLEVGAVSVEESNSHLGKSEKDCRICHLSLDAGNQEAGVPIELGCSCKDDLAAAHKQCAEAWFKIKGNKTCEICGSTARNVVGLTDAEVMEHWVEPNDASTASLAATMVHPSETRNFWQGHRFLNFLLACMVFAFVISWLFHFNIPS